MDVYDTLRQADSTLEGSDAAVTPASRDGSKYTEFEFKTTHPICKRTLTKRLETALATIHR